MVTGRFSESRVGDLIENTGELRCSNDVLYFLTDSDRYRCIPPLYAAAGNGSANSGKCNLGQCRIDDRQFSGALELENRIRLGDFADEIRITGMPKSIGDQIAGVCKRGPTRG